MLHLFSCGSHCNVKTHFINFFATIISWLFIIVYLLFLFVDLTDESWKLGVFVFHPCMCYSIHLKWTPWAHFLMRNSLWRAGSVLPTVWQALSCFSPAESILKGLLMQLSPWHHSLSCLNIMGLRRHMRTHSWLLHDVDEWSQSFTALHIINNVVNYKLTIQMTENDLHFMAK